VLAKDKVEVIQQSIPDQACHAFIQDIQTRWNATFYMLDPLLEQKEATDTVCSTQQHRAAYTAHK